MLDEDGFTIFKQDNNEHSDHQLCPYCNKPLSEIKAHLIKSEYRIGKVILKLALSCTTCKKLLGFTAF